MGVIWYKRGPTILRPHSVEPLLLAALVLPLHAAPKSVTSAILCPEAGVPSPRQATAKSRSPHSISLFWVLCQGHLRVAVGRRAEEDKRVRSLVTENHIPLGGLLSNFPRKQIAALCLPLCFPSDPEKEEPFYALGEDAAPLCTGGAAGQPSKQCPM